MNSSNNTNSKNINEVLISNYLNTINIGYNGLSEINKNIDFEGEDNNTKDQTKLELEPTPSFILCLQKTNNLWFINNYNLNVYIIKICFFKLIL